MSIISEGPEAQDKLFSNDLKEQVPSYLARATMRLEFPPSYVIVGVYRLCTDKSLLIPAWDKCRHAFARGALVGAGWAFLTFNIQKGFLQFFLANSPRITGLSDDKILGLKVPFGVHTYAAFLLVGAQVTFILKFFLSRNIRIARDRVWDQTVKSRGYTGEFWQPYVEEWDNPPVVHPESRGQSFLTKMVGGYVGRMVIKRILLLPFAFVPFVGILISAALKALGTGTYLHEKYFTSKKMTERQRALFVEERKWEYRMFGFTAALLEGLPFVGLFFTVSNRVGAAMWAHDLEKRQHYVADQKAKKILQS
ncbi:hypothetical protein C8J56DRAFT_863949 [Mycena floridula]|nr:hypothetical protein C8J56DRAFT_863949 [Mycena floridula]